MNGAGTLSRYADIKILEAVSQRQMRHFRAGFLVVGLVSLLQATLPVGSAVCSGHPSLRVMEHHMHMLAFAVA